MSKIQQILDFCTDNNIEIVSYGLAPNPNGFCYELPENLDDTDAYETLNKMLDALTAQQVVELRKIIFGGK